MITSLKSKMNILLKNRRIHEKSDKHVLRFKYSLLALCIFFYIFVFAASSEIPLGDMSIENKNMRSTEYFNHIPAVKGSVFIGKDEDVVLVPVGE
jgi:hypothetical protein